MQTLNCPNCGANLPERALKTTDLVTCDFCGTTFRLPKTLTPEPDMGDLLLGADFSDKDIPGWEVFNDGNLRFQMGYPSELHATFEPSGNTKYVLASSGLLDDFDVSINLRFTEGDREIIRGGFYPRYIHNEGGYAVFTSAQQSYTVAHYTKDEKNEVVWNAILPWTHHSALKDGLHVNNRLRVICHGERLSIYLNGVLATSFKDTRYKRGRVYIAVAPTEKSKLGVVFSDLQLREAR